MCYTNIQPMSDEETLNHYYKVVMVNDHKYYGLFTWAALARDRWVTAWHVESDHPNIPLFMHRTFHRTSRGHTILYKYPKFKGFGLFKTRKDAVRYHDSAGLSEQYQHLIIKVKAKGEPKSANISMFPFDLRNIIPCHIFNQIKVIN